MGKIYYVIGKSSSGKDTIYKQLIQRTDMDLHELVLYTTRPIRSGETDGVEYFFVSEEQYEKLKSAGSIIEERAYQTVYGIWHYFTVDDGQIDLLKYNYLVTGTLESFCSTREYFGDKDVLPIYIDLDDGVRLQRALQREQQQQEPKYKEMCRRFIADAEDFSEDKIQKANISKVFYNDDLTRCIEEIATYIKQA
ncbi:MAG: guanylate kinase [bacterium]|nr:guanylate kinase [bacterium]